MTVVSIYTPRDFDMYDSYGLVGCQLVRHLTRAGVTVNALAMGDRVHDSQPPDIRAVTSRPVRPAMGGLALGYPTGYGQYSALLHHGPRVAITMFESSRLPVGWVAALNDVDAVVVPSWFCHQVFVTSGVTVPVHVVPLGIGEHYTLQKRPEGRPLTFLAFLDRGERKGGVTALQGFLRAFGDDMDFRLILKGRTPKEGRQFTLNNPNIEVVMEDLTEAELASLYGRCDILINPHYGEGFGLIPREFAATGGLAMTTGWSGTVDDLGHWGMPIAYDLVPAQWRGNRTLEGQDLGEWARVDPARLAHQLRNVVAMWPWLQQQLPAKAEAARQLYRWDAFATEVLSIWKGVVHGNRARATATAA